MKKLYRMLALVTALAAVLALTACGPKTPQKIGLKSEGYLFRQGGETLNLAEQVVIEEEKASKEVTYESSDPKVVTVSPEGILTAVAPGTAVVTVASAADKSISAAADVLVYDFTGFYTTEKYIDAMGCNVRVNLDILPDGSYRFYRYPMNVALEGGGLMEGMPDGGTYVTEGSGLRFTGEYLKDFFLKLGLDKAGQPLLTGKTPTGGAATDMEFSRGSREDRGESGLYAGTGETGKGDSAAFRLKLDKGSFTLSVGTGAQEQQIISSGVYAFFEDTCEFWAEEGPSFRAVYDEQRQVMEGTEIPVSTLLEDAPVAATLTRE